MDFEPLVAAFTWYCERDSRIVAWASFYGFRQWWISSAMCFVASSVKSTSFSVFLLSVSWIFILNPQKDGCAIETHLFGWLIAWYSHDYIVVLDLLSPNFHVEYYLWTIESMLSLTCFYLPLFFPVEQLRARVDVVTVGKLSLNLTSFTRESASVFGKQLTAAIQMLLPFTHAIPLTVEYLNTVTLKPRKNNQTGR